MKLPSGGANNWMSKNSAVTASRFWEKKSLTEMTTREWESLCDGCGKCCLVKLEDSDTGKVHYTNVACHLLNAHTSQCKDYGHRKAIVPDCIALTPHDVEEFQWLPVTCAYRLIHEGKDLPDWHPLVTGDRQSVHDAGMSVSHRVVKETSVIDIEAHVVDWVK